MADSLNLLGKFTDDGKFIEIDESFVHLRMFKPYMFKELEVEVSIYKKKRTDAQNRYFHGVCCVRIIAFEKRNGATWLENLTSKEAMETIKAHIYSNVLKQRITMRVVQGKEVMVQTGKRMSEMNVEEFTNAVEEIRSQYAEIGCDIPDPIANGFMADYINAQNKNRKPK